jgi:uncharacterized protein YjbI with pentapeptide repeats
LILFVSSFAFSQKADEYYLLNTEINEFDVLGTDEYEKNLSEEDNINVKLKVQVGADQTAEPVADENFIAKNTLDANMKTAWLTPAKGKSAQIEYIIDLKEANLNSATLFQMAVFNGWRKDYQTWNDYSRAKKIMITINDAPYAEVTLEDTYKLQYIDLDRKKLDDTRRFRLRIKIMETYPGKKYEQMGLSDVQFIGKAK